ncbi:MAG: hypothetical protein ACI4QS_12500 [Comamonas sp.]
MKLLLAIAAVSGSLLLSGCVLPPGHYHGHGHGHHHAHPKKHPGKGPGHKAPHHRRHGHHR